MGHARLLRLVLDTVPEPSLRAQTYKLAPTDQILDGDSVVRVGGLSLPTEATVVDAWPGTGLTSGTVYLRTGDSSRTDLPDESVDLIVTDPPYMDNVHYSELADFFHAWLRELAPFAHYPREQATTRSTHEVQSASPTQFQVAITRVWQECARVLKPDGLLAFTFHQARLSGWVALVQALAKAGLVVTAVQPVKGEMTTSVTKGGIEPSNLDAVVVCRKRASAVPSSLTQPHAAAEAGERRLTALQSAGVDVGAGDIRSVIRGHVLATYTASPEAVDVQSLAALADQLAAERVARLAGRNWAISTLNTTALVLQIRRHGSDPSGVDGPDRAPYPHDRATALAPVGTRHASGHHRPR